MKRLFPAVLALMLCSGGYATHAQGIDTRTPVTIGESSQLPLRVLTRPNATLYADKEGVTIVQSNLPTFQSFFVYDRPLGEALATQTGWYEVGKDDKGAVVGWIKGEDVFEWKQTMCLSYAHPEGRKPVLMFEDEESLAGLAESDATSRAEKANAYYQAIDEAAKGKTLDAEFPIVSVEPKMAVDASKQFYLLPILEHKMLSFDGREGRLLRVAAVSGSGEKAREKSDIRTNKDFLESAVTGVESQAQKLEELKIDLVWVIDTTRSMGPYIEATRAVMEKVSSQVAANPALKGKIAFGVWGYRDPETIPEIGYNTKNFTPELQPVESFLSIMKEVKETKTDSVDVEENVYAGMVDAIEKTAWRPNAIRIIVLVGDAPAHNAGHKWNTSGQDENTIRALANEKGITVFALHIMPPSTKKYNKLAARQFKALAINPGMDKPMYGRVAGKNVTQFDTNAATITEAVVSFGSVAAKGNSTIFTDPQPDTPKGDTSTENKLAAGTLSRADVDKTIRAAAVTWLGRQAEVKAPRDVEAWVTDKDLIDTTRPSLEVRLLLNKRQLDSLATLLSEILAAGRENQISGDDFFTSLQAASAVVSRDPDMLSNTGTLADSGLIPDFLAGLPYHSQLMDISNDLWASWGPDEQDAFLSRLEAKCKAYSSIHDDPELWVALNPGDDPSEFVSPVQLDLMP